MPLTQLAPPYPIFTDKNGDPLDAGYLYFGVVNLNPETNPIQVYYDSALTQPAAQPLRTSNGYVMRNGSPALLFAGSQFSVTVRDKSNSLVIYSPVGYGIDPASVSGTVIYDDFTGDGVTTIFTLTASPSTKNATNVYIDGIYQSKDNYNTVGSTLTFTTAPPLLSAIEVVSQETAVIGGASSQQISYNQGGTGAVNRTVQARLRDYVSVKDFGAVGDGVTDDLVAIQSAISYLKALGGGTIHFPNGTYRVTGEILIDSPSIRFTGTGRRKVYPGLFVPSADGLPTIMPVHSSTAAVRFFSAAINTASTFSAQDINFATLETGLMPTCCFGFDGSGNFHRDYTFDRVGIHGFTSAFDTYNTGVDPAFGLAKIINCAINRNGYIARNLTGQWNGFVFEKNEAGQNLTGGIDIKAQAASIRQNSMEGQPNTIRITGNYRAVTVAENYFELNSGAYCVRLSETLGAVVENNFWQNVTATEPLSLVYDVGTTVNDRVIPSCLGSFDLRTDKSAINPVPLGGASAAFFANTSHIKSAITGFTELGGYQTTPAGPHYAFPESAGNIVTTSGTGLTSIVTSGLSIASGNYIAVSFLISYQDEPVLPPRFELSVNGTNVNGFINPIFYSFDKANLKLKNNTMLYFGIVKATASCTSLGTRIYPHGLNPAAGLVSYVSLPAIYDLGSTIPATDQVGPGVAAFLPETHVQRVLAAPVAGTWPIGYKLHARAPAAGGFEGWICTTAGTPGTWKTFGAITP